MRKPRDYDAALKALDDRARELKSRKVQQLGSLVIATDADVLPIDLLAGALLAAVDTKDDATKEAWTKRGVAFFQRTAGDADGAGQQSPKSQAGDGGALPLAGPDRAER